MTASRLHHVGLTVADLETSVAFYCRHFSCRVVERAETDGAEIERILGEAGVRMLTADLALPAGDIVELIQYRAPEGAVLHQRDIDAGATHFAICVDDIDATHRRLVADGAAVRSQPVLLNDAGKIWTGARVFYLNDPDGRTIEVIQLPPDSGCAPADPSHSSQRKG